MRSACTRASSTSPRRRRALGGADVERVRELVLAKAPAAAAVDETSLRLADVLDAERLSVAPGHGVADTEADPPKRRRGPRVAPPLARAREVELDLTMLDRDDRAEPELRLGLAHPALPDRECLHRARRLTLR